MSWKGDGSASLSGFMTGSRSSAPSYELDTELSYSSSTLGYLSDSRRRSPSRNALARQLVKMRRHLEEEIRLEQQKQRSRYKQSLHDQQQSKAQDDQQKEIKAQQEKEADRRKHQDEMEQLARKHRDEIDNLVTEQVGTTTSHS